MRVMTKIRKGSRRIGSLFVSGASIPLQRTKNPRLLCASGD
jgi:hypothetical protein